MFNYYNKQRIKKKALFIIEKKKIEVEKNAIKVFY